MNENRNAGPTPPTKLTPRILTALAKGARVRDTAAVGLFAERGQRGNVRMKFQADLRRPGERVRTVRIDLGRWPDEIDLDAARKKAAEHVEAIKAKRDPRVPAPAAGAVWTVSEAFNAYTDDALKARGDGAQRSVADMLERRDRYLVDWKDRPLTEITALDCRALHDQIIATVRGRARSDRHTGERTANMVLKDLRSVWKLGAQVFPAVLPVACPAAAVRLAGERKEHGFIALADFPKWKVTIDALDSPVRRGLHRVQLFAGLRPSNAAGLKRAWVDLEGGWLRIPGSAMKNRQAFACPLSKALVKLLGEALRVGQDQRRDSPWVFPASSESGHVEVTRERGLPPGWTGHGLRHSYSNAAEQAGVSGDLRQMLLGQRVGGVRGTYLTPTELEARLRTAQEQISRRLLALLAGRG